MGYPPIASRRPAAAHERLQALVGHDFIIDTVDDGDETGVPSGRLQESGEDYIIIATKSLDEGGFVERGGEFFVPLQDITHLIHTVTDCAGCAVDAAVPGNGGR
jgi:hypothetical protein